MQTRHRIPSIFNLSMVDVLCCALGCIILLWLVYFKEARTRAVAAGETSKQLCAAKAELQSVVRDLTEAQRSLLAGKQHSEFLRGQLTEITGHRDQLLAQWEKTDKDYQVAQLGLKDATATIADLQKAVRDLEKLGSDQKSALAAAAGQTEELQSRLREAEKRRGALDQQVSALAVQSKDYGSQLAKIETRAMGLESELDKRKLELVEANKRVDDLATVKDLLQQSLTAAKGDLAKSTSDLVKSTKDLAEIRLANHGLVGETKVLSQQLNLLKAAAENRFAGIELTGSRVLFLVDMSGSMGMKNDETVDPNKWPLVCEILGKLMRSLPNLNQFQIILFSNRIRYPLGAGGRWQDYYGPQSLKIAIASVRAVMPQNETNMSAVFEEAFRFRPLGLDTIYLLSDGLPNSGTGLPANAKQMTEAERSVLLGKYVRDRLKTTWNAPLGSNKQRVRINAVGFYYDSPDVGAFLWALARDNDGSFVGLSKP